MEKNNKVAIIQKALRSTGEVFGVKPLGLIEGETTDKRYKVLRAKRLAVEVLYRLGMSYEESIKILKYSKRGGIPVIKSMTEYPIKEALVAEVLENYNKTK